MEQKHTPSPREVPHDHTCEHCGEVVYHGSSPCTKPLLRGFFCERCREEGLGGARPMNATKPEPWAVCWNGEHIDTFDSEKTARATLGQVVALGALTAGVAFPVSAINEARDFAEDMASGRCYCEDAPEGEHGKIVCDSCRAKTLLALLGGGR